MYLQCDICNYRLTEAEAAKVLLHHGDGCPVCLDDCEAKTVGIMREYDETVPTTQAPWVQQGIRNTKS